MTSIPIAAVVAAVLSAGLVGLVRRHALRRGLLDHPNARSSHTAATPRGGGLGLVLGWMGALLLTLVPWRAVAPGIDAGPFAEPLALAGLLAAVAGVAAIGWVDDHGGASVRLRLVVHLVAAAALWPLVQQAPLLMPLALLGVAWWVFWTVAAVNVVNFMDGIDGLIGLQLALFGTAVAIHGVPGGAARLAGAVLAGACAGFLLWNWSPARIFLGDVGSGTLGLIAVATGALLVAERRVDFVAAFAPLAPIFLDAAVTLVRRARRGERLSEAHRSHLYQRLARSGHARVTLGYGAAAVVCAGAAAAWPRGGLPLLALLVGSLGAAWWWADRRAP
jgi:Fuc2NAc and GlcNAc transferase